MGILTFGFFAHFHETSNLENNKEKILLGLVRHVH
jgi:hypothetical protein